MTLNRWYQKAAYVIGWIAIAWIVLAIIYGVIYTAVYDGRNQATVDNSYNQYN